MVTTKKKGTAGLVIDNKSAQFAALDYEMPDQVFMSGKLNEYLKVRFVIHTL